MLNVKEFVLLVRCLIDLIPSEGKMREGDSKLVVDGANGVGGEKLEVLKTMLDNKLFIEVRNSGKDGVLNEGVGADFVQKEKVFPRGFGSQDIGMRSVICSHLFLLVNKMVLIICTTKNLLEKEWKHLMY